MANEIKIEAQLRTGAGSADARRLRRTGSIPGVVYGAKQEATAITLNAHSFQQLLRHHTSESLIVDLQIGDGAVVKVLLKDVQHHPVKNQVLHIDFHAISMTEKLHVLFPLEFVGEPVGVAQGGGILESLLREIEVECLPSDILEQVEVDVSALDINDNLSVKDVVLDSAKYRILTSLDVAVVAVAPPRVDDSADEEETGDEAGVVPGAAEPEVLKEKAEE